MKADWTRARVARCGTHHELDGRPLYTARFDEVLKYHLPGLAPARDGTGAFHIDPEGLPTYAARYRRSFGFYEGLAAVVAEDGWHHVRLDGTPAYAVRWDWCGNFQGGLCTVRTPSGRYGHIRPDGSPATGLSWRYAGDFRDGLAVVQGDDGRSTHIDGQGGLLHGRCFLDLDVFHKGYARARDEGGWMHVDERGRPAYARRFAAVEPFYNGQARVERPDGGREVIDERGETRAVLRGADRDPLHTVSAELVSFWRCESIFAAVNLGVFERLPLTAPTERLAVLLHALGELGLVQLDGDTWRATELGTMLRADHPRSLAAAARYWSGDGRRGWASLPQAIADASWHAEDPFAAVAHDPERVAAFHAALRPYAENDYAGIAAVIDPSGGTVIDAGGGTGALAVALLRGRPGIQAVVLDRPEVAALGAVPDDLDGRLRFQCGDLFGPWPVRGEGVVLARVLHDWPDEACGTLLAHARDALAPGGRLYVVELLRPDEGFAGGLLSLHLLVSTGGKERRREEYARLLAAAGLKLVEVRPTPAISAVLVAEVA